MLSAPGQLVLAITDSGLRSVLTAELGLAGEMPISTADHLDPTLGKEIRSKAVLIIEESLINSDPQDWAETLRNQCWTGQIIIIVNQQLANPPSDKNVTLIRRNDAGVAILALVRLWQIQNRDAVSSLE